MDTNRSISSTDSNVVFHVRNLDIPLDDDAHLNAHCLSDLIQSWDAGRRRRQTMTDTEWADGLASYLRELAQERVQHVQDWIAVNTSRFSPDHAEICNLQRVFQSAVVEIQSSIEICRSTCVNCRLLCIKGRRHDGLHDCGTPHTCIHACDFEHKDSMPLSCGLP